MAPTSSSRHPSRAAQGRGHVVTPDGRGTGPAKATRGPVVSQLPHQPCRQPCTAQCCTMGGGHRKAECHCWGARVHSPLSLPVGKFHARGTGTQKIFWDTGWVGPMVPPYTAAGKTLCRHLQEHGHNLLALRCHARLPSCFPHSSVPQVPLSAAALTGMSLCGAWPCPCMWPGWAAGLQVQNVTWSSFAAQ